jgi:hypothetical protein
LTIEGVCVREKNKNYELKTPSWGWVGFHPIQKTLKWDLWMVHWWVLGHWSPRKKRNFIRHEIFFLFNQAMIILGGHESYNTLILKECKWLWS